MGSMYWIGFAATSGVIVPFLDCVGRRKPACAMIALSYALAVQQSLTTSVWVFGVTQFMMGMTFPVAALACNLLALESAPRELRLATTVALNVAWVIACLFLAAVGGWVTRSWSWRAEVLMWYSLTALWLLPGLTIVKESPSFKAAAQAYDTKESSLSTARIFEAPYGRRLFVMTLTLSVSSLAFHGLTFSVGTLSDNLYMNAIWLSMADLVGNALPQVIVARLGSKNTLISCFVGAGVVLVTCGRLPRGSSSLLACALSGRLLIGVAFITYYFMIVELFPAEVRATASGCANIFARLVTFLAPYSAMLPAAVTCPLLGLLSLAAAGAITALLDDVV